MGPGQQRQQPKPGTLERCQGASCKHGGHCPQLSPPPRSPPRCTPACSPAHTWAQAWLLTGQTDVSPCEGHPCPCLGLAEADVPTLLPGKDCRSTLSPPPQSGQQRQGLLHSQALGSEVRDEGEPAHVQKLRLPGKGQGAELPTAGAGNTGDPPLWPPSGRRGRRGLCTIAW